MLNTLQEVQFEKRDVPRYSNDSVFTITPLTPVLLAVDVICNRSSNSSVSIQRNVNLACSNAFTVLVIRD